MSKLEQAFQRGREQGAREEASQWQEATRPEVIAEALHDALTHQYDECPHGTYSGGTNHGKPYKMCEILAGYLHRRIV